MSVKKLSQQKKQAEKHLADLNAQIIAGIQPKLREAVALLESHRDVVANDQEIQRLVADAVNIVYGEDATVGNEHKARRRPKGREMTSLFDWQRLTQALIDAGVTTAQKGLTKSELEELYFGDVGVRFEHNRWSDKDSKAEWLLTNPKSSPKLRRYWVNAKRAKK